MPQCLASYPSCGNSHVVDFGCALAQSVRFWWLLLFSGRSRLSTINKCKCTSVLKNCHLKKFILSIGSKCIYMCFGFSVSRCNSPKKTFVTESFGVKCIFACQNTRDAWDDLIAPSIEFLRESPAMSRSVMTLAHI